MTEILLLSRASLVATLENPSEGAGGKAQILESSTVVLQYFQGGTQRIERNIRNSLG